MVTGAAVVTCVLFSNAVKSKQQKQGQLGICSRASVSNVPQFSWSVNSLGVEGELAEGFSRFPSEYNHIQTCALSQAGAHPFTNSLPL